MNKRTLLLLAAVLPILLAGIAWMLISSPYSAEHDEPLEIPRGTSLRGIAELLEDNDVVRNDLLFIAAAKLTGKDGRLQSGLYNFPAGASTLDILTILADGSHQAYRNITIREGLTIRRIATHLDTCCGFSADTILKLSRDPSFISSFKLDEPSLEGYLLPETYRVRFDISARELLGMLVHNMLDTFSPKDRDQMKRTGRDMHEILTMASLVEGETRLDRERARVAGVYYNRLRRGMLLQADPTIQYIIPDGPRRLLYRDLSINSPYNTYRYPGLPPGPVNNPGKASIHAALYPETHDFYYFVADGSGGHRFSRTIEEHNRAVAAYRRLRR
ncbi:endolytic transglycosylase MltG [bacterium]|nr:endolytic transglycosylase MltG [bacterium]